MRASDVLWIGHRGWGQDKHFENTIDGISRANAYADWIEIDLRLTHDSKIIVFHDDTLSRMYGTAIWCENVSWKDMNKIADGRKPDPLLFEDVLDHFAGQPINFNLDIKSDGMGKQLNAILRYYVENNFYKMDQFCISSFNHHDLKYYKKRGWKVGYLCVEPPRKIKKNRLYIIEHFEISSSLVGRIHKKKSRVWAYTVNEVLDIYKCKNAGVDGIITDFLNFREL